MMLLTTLKFPEIQLPTRDAHKLRGYFGSVFAEHSELLHNHDAAGNSVYGYPKIQYKVINGIPILIGEDAGALLLPTLFMQTRQLEIGKKVYEINGKHIEHKEVSAGIGTVLSAYRFATLWMPLNQENYRKYLHTVRDEKPSFLNRLLVNNLLSLFKGLGIRLLPHERVMAHGFFQERSTKFKDQTMLAFSGSFVSNALIPTGLGIGKSVARGFGTVLPE